MSTSVSPPDQQPCENTNALTVRLFGAPAVYRFREKIAFPTRKSEALFYYLMVRKEASRDELAALFWPDADEISAKKNLRDSLYKIKKHLGDDVLNTQHKQSAALNPDIPVRADLFEMMESREPLPLAGDFLQGFLVRDAEPFNQWMRAQAEFYRNIHISRLWQSLESHMQNGNPESCLPIALELIRIDEFEERAHRLLMEIHRRQGAFGKAIEVYAQLRTRLDAELGIAPEPATRELYKKILELRNATAPEPAAPPRSFFYGRRRELAAMLDTHRRFLRNEPFKHIILAGEAGVGKSRLKEYFLEQIRNDSILILETECFQAEEHSPLKSWNAIFAALSQFINTRRIPVPRMWRDIVSCAFPGFAEPPSSENQNTVEKLDALKPKLIEDAAAGVIRAVAAARPLVLAVEDLHWMDPWSLSLLQTIAAGKACPHVFLTATTRPSARPDIERFLSLPELYLKRITINLPRFSESETLEFITNAMPNLQLTGELRRQIHRETEGIAFFILEYLNMIQEKGHIEPMSQPMEEILNSRVADISGEGKKLLNILCLFFDGVSPEILSSLGGRDELDLADGLEELKNRFIIREIVSGSDIIFRFTHQKLREFIHRRLSPALRRALHQKAGLLLERRLRGDSRDPLLYPALIYHFTNGGNLLNAFKYTLRNANSYLDVTHELFPSGGSGAAADTLSLSGDQLGLRYIRDAEDQLSRLLDLDPGAPGLADLETEFLHMKGRFLIREGEYASGLTLIERVISRSLQNDRCASALKGYIQMIYYAIQIHDADIMAAQLEPALKLARRRGEPKDLATLLRLDGLRLIMSGQYEEAEHTLLESLTLFESLNGPDGDAFALCIAAIYNYLGEIRRFNRRFAESATYYQKAIGIGRKNNARDSLAVFYVHAGQAAFDSGDYTAAADCFRESLDLYERFDGLWGRSTAAGYSALLAIRDNDPELARRLLTNAETFAAKLKNPYEMGLLCRVKAEIRAAFDAAPHVQNTFAPILAEPTESLCNHALQLLGSIRESYESDMIRTLKNGRRRSVCLVS